MLTRTLHTLALIATVALAGCATTPQQCNPHDRQASLLTKMSCDSSGAYREVVVQREQDVVLAQQENAQFQALFESIEKQRLSLRQDLAQQQQAHAQMVTTTQNLLNQLASKQGNNAKLKSQLSAAQRDLNALKAAPPTPQSASNPQEVAAKQAQLQSLQQTALRLQESLGYGQ